MTIMTYDNYDLWQLWLMTIMTYGSTKKVISSWTARPTAVCSSDFLYCGWHRVWLIHLFSQVCDHSLRLLLFLQLYFISIWLPRLCRLLVYTVILARCDPLVMVPGGSLYNILAFIHGNIVPLIHAKLFHFFKVGLTFTMDANYELLPKPQISRCSKKVNTPQSLDAGENFQQFPVP